MQEERIPTIVWLTPILPFINDTEENLKGILEYCVTAGVIGIVNFGMGVTLREGNREYFYHALDQVFPGLSEKHRNKYGYDYVLNSPNGKHLLHIFREIFRKAGIMYQTDQIFDYLKEFPEKVNIGRSFCSIIDKIFRTRWKNVPTGFFL